jgi:hypothetical protein
MTTVSSQNLARNGSLEALLAKGCIVRHGSNFMTIMAMTEKRGSAAARQVLPDGRTGCGQRG